MFITGAVLEVISLPVIFLGALWSKSIFGITLALFGAGMAVVSLICLVIGLVKLRRVLRRQP